jgi:hypothetical protein
VSPVPSEEAIQWSLAKSFVMQTVSPPSNVSSLANAFELIDNNPSQIDKNKAQLKKGLNFFFIFFYLKLINPNKSK